MNAAFFRALGARRARPARAESPGAEIVASPMPQEGELWRVFDALVRYPDSVPPEEVQAAVRRASTTARRAALRRLAACGGGAEAEACCTAVWGLATAEAASAELVVGHSRLIE